MQETRNNSFEAKYVPWPLVNLTIVFDFVRCCYISALVLTCFRLTKGRATFFWPKTIVKASFLHLMVLLSKVSLNHFWKRQFVVLPCHTQTQTFTSAHQTEMKQWIIRVKFAFLDYVRKISFSDWTCHLCDAKMWKLIFLDKFI